MAWTAEGILAVARIVDGMAVAGPHLPVVAFGQAGEQVGFGAPTGPQTGGHAAPDGAGTAPPPGVGWEYGVFARTEPSAPSRPCRRASAQPANLLSNSIPRRGCIRMLDR